MKATAREKDSDEEATPSWMRGVSERIDGAAHAKDKQDLCTATDDDPCKDSKDVVSGAFAFMQGDAAAELDKLAADLKKVDKPTWQEQLLEQCMDVALMTGGSLAGEYLVHKLGDTFKKEAKAAAEFIKKSLEDGAPKGAKAALSKLNGDEQPDVDEFIAAQKIGLNAMYQEAAANFIKVGRHELKTTRDASELEAALDPAHLAAAAQKQYAASRDAYLTCLAKQTLGTTRSGTTNMSPHRASADGGHAPELAGAMFGIDKGVLTVKVFLCDDVSTEPHVWGSYLNGVNDSIREQYQDKRLSALRIPRQLVCSVRGDMADFTVNVDEAGAMELVSGDGAWLQARARSARPEVANQPRAAQNRVGLELLLEDLRIAKIGHGGNK